MTDLQYCLSVMIQNKTKNTAGYNKTNQSSESSKSILSLNSSLIPHLCCQQQAFHTSQTTSKVLNRLHFALVATVDTHLSFENLQKFGWKHCKTKETHAMCLEENLIVITGTIFGFQHRKFSKLSHFSASSCCVATVAICLHVADRRLWYWSKQSPISTWSDQRVNYFSNHTHCQPCRERSKRLCCQTSQRQLLWRWTLSEPLLGCRGLGCTQCGKHPHSLWLSPCPEGTPQQPCCHHCCSAGSTAR